jgi:hypothetical protein
LRKFFDDAAAVTASLASNWGSFLTYIEDRARALGSGASFGSSQLAGERVGHSLSEYRSYLLCIYSTLQRTIFLPAS